jgi:HTH-type transcriptional regulator / antitoxin HigA
VITEINNDKELDEALGRLEEIWSARFGDPSWKERCLLINLIEAYEEQAFCISSPSPFDAILFRMEQDEDRKQEA